MEIKFENKEIKILNILGINCRRNWFMEEKKVIGITGMPGSGKGTATEALRKEGYPVVIMGDLIREETEKRGLPPTPENVGKVMLKIREEGGPGVVAKRCLQKIRETEGPIVIVEGIRGMAEVNEFREHFPSIYLVAVHASPGKRFQRLRRRGRSDDSRTLEEFERRDLRELVVGVGSVIAVADSIIINETTPKQLVKNTVKMLEKAKKHWKK
jgi:dephospho-CoA kinase